MKKMMILLGSLMTLATAVTAQVRIAPEVGVNFANMRGNYKFTGENEEKFKGGAKIGVRAGANVNIDLTSRLQLQPGLFYSIKGFKQGSEQNWENGLFNAPTKENVTVHYAEVPVNLQYMFNDPDEGRFFVGLGGYMAVAFSGKTVKEENTPSIFPSLATAEGISSTGGSLKFGNDAPSNDMRRFDFGAQVNAGYLLRSGIFFRAMYQLGIANMLPQGNRTTGDATLRNSNINASIGYTIGYRK